MTINDIISVLEQNPIGHDIQQVVFNREYLINSDKVVFIIPDNSDAIIEILSNLTSATLNILRGPKTNFERNDTIKVDEKLIQEIYNYNTTEYSSVSCIYYTDNLDFIAITDSDNYACILVSKRNLMTLLPLTNIFTYYANLYSDYHYNKYKIFLINMYSEFFLTKKISAEDFQIESNVFQ